MSFPLDLRTPLNRRTVLAGTAGAAALAVAAPGVASARTGAAPIADPFTLGVASGDPLPDGMVLWTRLAPDPTAADGLGGMPLRNVEVEWELAADEGLSRVERRGVVTAVPESAHSVHVELAGLREGPSSSTASGARARSRRSAARGPPRTRTPWGRR